MSSSGTSIILLIVNFSSVLMCRQIIGICFINDNVLAAYHHTFNKLDILIIYFKSDIITIV